jgi:hypothetical protein
MLTSFVVRCPHPECRWFGSLIPTTTAGPLQGKPGVRPEVVFRCPSCKNEWHARVVGDDVRPLPLATVGA